MVLAILGKRVLAYGKPAKYQEQAREDEAILREITWELFSISMAFKQAHDSQAGKPKNFATPRLSKFLVN
jgi:hypothetical protein